MITRWIVPQTVAGVTAGWAVAGAGCGMFSTVCTTVAVMAFLDCIKSIASALLAELANKKEGAK